MAATGSTHTCAVIKGGFVKCWGENQRGEVGVGDHMPHLEPIDVMLDADVAGIAAGDFRTVVLDLTGRVFTWGALSDFVSVESPAQITTLGAALSVSAGFQDCAVLETGQVQCWGSDHAFDLSLTSETPVLPGRAIAVAVGRSFTCALLETGDLSCWGDNYAGQLGLGNTLSQPTPSAPIAVGGRAVAVTAGYRHTCVRLDDGAIKCWGDNSSGQLGLGDRRDRGATPETVPAMLPAIAFP